MEIGQKRWRYQTICTFSKTFSNSTHHGIVKVKACKKAYSISYNRCEIIKRFEIIVFALNLKAFIVLKVIITISASDVQQLPSTNLSPEYCSKTVFYNDGSHHFGRGVCTDANDTPYARPFTFSSNSTYSMSPRPSVLEQSTQDRSNAVPFFFYSVDLPTSNLKPMAHVITCQRRPIDRTRS